MLYRVRVSYLTAAGKLAEQSFDVDRPDAQAAEEAAVREVLRQPGREIIGTEVERVK
jgi:hypothetical protein